jgi:hypothetical protein
MRTKHSDLGKNPGFPSEDTFRIQVGRWEPRFGKHVSPNSIGEIFKSVAVTDKL